MRIDKPTLVLALVLLIIGGGVSYWQAPGGKLDAEEIDSALRRISRSMPMPAADKAELLNNLRVWTEADDGAPVHMLNLMRYRSQLQAWPGTTPFGSTPQEANDYYEDQAIGIALPLGLSLAFSGVPQAAGTGAGLINESPGIQHWDRILVVRYPNRRAFLQLVSDPDYLKIMHNKFAAVELTLIPMQAATVTPDLRLLTWAATLLVFLSVGWWRASRSRR